MRWSLVAVLLAVGCDAGTGDGAEADGDCNAHAHRGLIGQPLSDPASVAALAPKVRLIRPGDAVTMDFQPDRLNVELDAAGRVVRVHCG